MLARRYEYKVYLGDGDPVFLITTALKTDLYPAGIDSRHKASTGELRAPSLTVRPYYDGFSTENIDPWVAFTSGYSDQPEVPEEILKAFRGERSDWKVVRCEMKPDSICFLCVDPEKMRRESPDEFYKRTGEVVGNVGRDFDFEHGLLWVYFMIDAEAPPVGVNIFVQHGNWTRHYELFDIRRNKHFTLKEYDDSDEVFRISCLNIDGDEDPYGYATIDVVECFE